MCVFNPSSSLRLSLQDVLSSYNREVTGLMRSKVSKERITRGTVIPVCDCVVAVCCGVHHLRII